MPEGFEPKCPGVEMYSQPSAQYAKITVYDPFQAAFDRIPKGYKKILEYLGANGFKENHGTEFLGCFEEVYEKDGTTCMDISSTPTAWAKVIYIQISAEMHNNRRRTFSVLRLYCYPIFSTGSQISLYVSSGFSAGGAYISMLRFAASR